MHEKLGPSLILKSGREKPLLRRHPWIFSGAIERVEGNPKCGDIVGVYARNGSLLGYGAYSHNSQIKCRIWKFTSTNKNPDYKKLLQTRLKNAIKLRKNLNLQADNTAYRLVHAESDLIPGLVVDLYNTTAIIQLLSCGVEVHRDIISEILLSQPFIDAVYERSDAEVRNLEGLPLRVGHVVGKKKSELVTITEYGIKYKCSPSNGQKTGFYLDQRENRYLLRTMAANKEVLDCFCYTGGFSINAYLGGANKITAVDVSEDSLNLFRKNVFLNQMNADKFKLIANDVFKQLRTFRDEGKQFDLIILDPPKFAPTKKQVNRASRGYKDINLLAFKLLKPGGILFTFSCSGGINADLFQKIIAGAASDAQVDVKIINRMTQAPDHPVLLSFPEGEYLKGFVCIKN